MKKYKVLASYLQWIEIEVEANDTEEVYDLIDDIDLDDYKQLDCDDFTIDHIEEITE